MTAQACKILIFNTIWETKTFPTIFHFQETALPFCLLSNLNTNSMWWWNTTSYRWTESPSSCCRVNTNSVCVSQPYMAGVKNQSSVCTMCHNHSSLHQGATSSTGSRVYAVSNCGITNRITAIQHYKSKYNTVHINKTK